MQVGETVAGRLGRQVPEANVMPGNGGGGEGATPI